MKCNLFYKLWPPVARGGDPFYWVSDEEMDDSVYPFGFAPHKHKQLGLCTGHVRFIVAKIFPVENIYCRITKHFASQIHIAFPKPKWRISIFTIFQKSDLKFLPGLHHSFLVSLYRYHQLENYGSYSYAIYMYSLILTQGLSWY